ncbi:hypothetical protein BC833DRAFT_353678 [Globomyces pollinis-pini]|nr:hypothetical protein BC833DRAFT_353678 [Globomyces pollinis-pini]
MHAALAWKLGCGLGLTSVGLGAFGAHGLKQKLANDPEGAKKVANWATAAHYQMVHSIVLLAYSLRAAANPPTSMGRLAPWFLVGGILMFSGSIYGLVLSSNVGLRKVFGPVTPLGGLTLIAGWGLLLAL